MSPVDLAGRGHHRDGIGVRCVILGDGPGRLDTRCGCNPLPVVLSHIQSPRLFDTRHSATKSFTEGA